MTAIAPHRSTDVYCCSEDVLQVRIASFALGGSDGDEHNFGPAHRGDEVEAKRQPLLANVLRDELLEPGLIDGDFAREKAVNFRSVDVHADNVIAGVGEAGPSDQAHIASPNDGEFHVWYLDFAQSARRGNDKSSLANVASSEEAPQAVRSTELAHPAELPERVNKDTLKGLSDKTRECRLKRPGDTCSFRKELRGDAARRVERAV